MEYFYHTQDSGLESQHDRITKQKWLLLKFAKIICELPKITIILTIR